MEAAEPSEREPRTVRSVAHAITLLKVIAKSDAPCSLGELADTVKLSKPATYNLLKTLEIEGLVTKNQSARYELSWGLFELGSAALRDADGEPAEPEERL